VYVFKRVHGRIPTECKFIERKRNCGPRDLMNRSPSPSTSLFRLWVD